MPFTIERNDLAKVDADAIVVAANEQLQITGGVGLTVALEAGLRELQAACDAIGYCPCGSAVATPGFGLAAKTIVHAVGPVWRGGDRGEVPLLRSAYDAALACAAASGARSVALPLISAGTYGFPPDVSLDVAREAIRTFLNSHDVEVRLVLYSREAVVAGIASFMDIVEYVDDHYVDAHPAYGTVVLPPLDWADAPAAAPLRERGGFAAAAAAPSALPSNMPKARRSVASRIGDAAERVRERFAGRADEGGREAAPAQTLAGAAKAEPEEAPVELAEDESATVWEPQHAQMQAQAQAPRSLEDLLGSLDASFSRTLLSIIDERGLTDASVYKRANMSRQLFSKIRSDENYRPTKKTAVALSIALELDLDETRDLLARAGFALSNSNKADVIVEYFITQGRHDIMEINEALYAFDQPLL